MSPHLNLDLKQNSFYRPYTYSAIYDVLLLQLIKNNTLQVLLQDVIFNLCANLDNDEFPVVWPTPSLPV